MTVQELIQRLKVVLRDEGNWDVLVWNPATDEYDRVSAVSTVDPRAVDPRTVWASGGLAVELEAESVEVTQ